ncbi:MAG: SDR family oxidoreductase [Planctomycetota bacterium]
MRFEGQTIFITGAAQGIGAATAKAFAAEGARVGVHCHHSREAGEALLKSLKGEGHRLFPADLREQSARSALVEAVLDSFGRIDVLVNNAAVIRLHPPGEVDESEWQSAWDDTLTVNLLAPADLCYRFGKHMIEKGGGRIINVSSRGAFKGEPEMPAYGASKAGLNALGQSLAVAWAKHGVTVTTVAPGWVHTERVALMLESEMGRKAMEQYPGGRPARPEEVANTILFLAGPGTDHLTGAIIDINGASYLR